MSSRWFKWLTNHPWLVIFTSILLALAAAYGAQNLVFKSDYRVFFGKDNPQLIAYESMQKIYNKSDTVNFILAPKNKQIFTNKNLAAIKVLTEASWQIPYSTRVDSITNFQYSHAEDDDMIVEDLVYDASTLTKDKIEKIKVVALHEPLLVNSIISKDLAVTNVSVTIQLPGKNPVKEMPTVVKKVRQLKAEFEAANPNVDVYLSGMIMMNTSFAESSIHDSSTLVPLMFLVVIITIGLLLKTITGTISTIVIIILSIVSTMGLAGWMGFYLTGPSASAPTMILTLAVADCIHILSTMFYEMRRGMEKKKAILESLKVNLQPIFLTSATTAIGFLSMNFSDSPPFQDLGNLVAIGVSIAFVLSITLFPAMLAALPLHVKQKPEEKHDTMDKISHFVIKQRKTLLPVMSVIMLGFAFFIPNNQLNDDFVKYFDETVPFRQATDFMQDHLTGMTMVEISVDSQKSSGINAPEYLKTLDNFALWLRAMPITDHVNTITDTMKRLNKNMHGDDPTWYKLPDNNELSAQYLLLYEMSLPYGLDLNNQLNVDKSSARIIATFKNMTSNEMLALEKTLQQWFKNNASQYKVTIASPSLMFAHIGQRNIRSMLIGTTAALFLISLLLAIALKSVRYGLISLLPNLAPAAVAFGLWGLFDGQVGLALSVVTGMTLGIVVDDTVHFLSKYLHARREKNANSQQAVQYAFGSVGRALWITTFVLVAGFSILAQSSFKLNSDAGLLTAITILIALVVDFLFLPPLLMKLDNGDTLSLEKK
ncbi:MAG: MMPL family transporter [Alteromonadaceae bacterium]|nr:MMPL family transporter [Alteromonadaceae bacterium]